MMFSLHFLFYPAVCLFKGNSMRWWLGDGSQTILHLGLCMKEEKLQLSFLRLNWIRSSSRSKNQKHVCCLISGHKSSIFAHFNFHRSPGKDPQTLEHHWLHGYCFVPRVSARVGAQLHPSNDWWESGRNIQPCSSVWCVEMANALFLSKIHWWNHTRTSLPRRSSHSSITWPAMMLVERLLFPVAWWKPFWRCKI